jgi:hypothetical protein
VPPIKNHPNKLGFHCGPAGNRTGIGDHFRRLASAGHRLVVKSVDDYGVITEALSADPDAVTIFRLTGGTVELPYRRAAAGLTIDAATEEALVAARLKHQPDYALDPLTTAKDHWAKLRSALPPEFDKRTWLEVMNEPDRQRSEWLAEFSFHLAHLMLAQDYRLATFSWSVGEPSPATWSGPKMINFLTLAAANPDNIAIALHEYSLIIGNIRHGYPWHIGRFLSLANVCKEWGITCPSILITEFGWTYNKVPGTVLAIEHLKWAAQFYNAHTHVLGAAIWYLGGGYGNIADQVQPLITHLTNLILSAPPPDPDPKPEAPEPIRAKVYQVTCRALNVRDKPTTATASNVIGQLPRGALIAAIAAVPQPDLKATWLQFGENVWAAAIYRGVTYMTPYIQPTT